MFKRGLLVLAAASALSAPPVLAAPSPGEAQFRAIFKEMIETDTSSASGDCTVAVNKVAARMRAAGFPAANIQILVPPNDARAGNLVALLPGQDPAAKPVLMLGHIDVVNAFRADWTRDPFTLIEENGEFYGRGVSDMKGQDAIWTDTILRFQQEGFRPRRTVKLALTCGEEPGNYVNGANWLAQNHKAAVDAGVALTEGGGGDLDDATGRKIAVTVMAAEKTTANFTFEITNVGGHSSKPRDDNAIYRMGKALGALQATQYPVQFNAFNRPYFEGIAPRVSPAEGAAIRRLLANPSDAAAAAVVKKNVSWRAMLGTTCIPTLIEGGHASNAQPQRVKATVNCRLLPGDPIPALTQTIIGAVKDPEVKIAPVAQNAGERFAIPPVTPALLDPIKKVAAEVYPGVPVVTMQETFGTDSGRLIAVGIPTWGVSGLFRGSDAGNIHGLNEHISVQSVMEGRDFLYKLIRELSQAPGA